MQVVRKHLRGFSGHYETKENDKEMFSQPFANASKPIRRRKTNSVSHLFMHQVMKKHFFKMSTLQNSQYYMGISVTRRFTYSELNCLTYQCQYYLQENLYFTLFMLSRQIQNRRVVINKISFKIVPLYEEEHLYLKVRDGLKGRVANKQILF